MVAERRAPAHARRGRLSAARVARVAVLAGPRQVDVQQRALRAPSPGRLLIQVEGCGVCGSNLPLWEGRPWFVYPRPPGTPGHEAWGRVAECGDGVEALRVGDRVAFLSDDAFAELVDVPAAEAVKLPPALGPGPFPGEALGCGFNIAARSGFAPGQSVCVVGAGFLGTVVTAIAAGAGARVTAVSRRSSSLELARLMGAATTVQLGSTDMAAAIASNQGRLFDVVVEAVGSQPALDLAGSLVTTRGRLVVAGYHQDGPRTVDLQLWNWRGIDVVNAHERENEVRLQGIRQAVAAVAEGWLDPTPLYTHTYPLERLGEAMDALAERPEGFLKALVCM